METDIGEAYYKLNKAVNNFTWIRTHPIIGEQTRRERIVNYVEKLKIATDEFLFQYHKRCGGKSHEENKTETAKAKDSAK